MRTKVCLFLVIAFLLPCLLISSPTHGAKRLTEIEKSTQFLDKFMYSLESGGIVPSQINQLKNYATKSRNDMIRIRAISLLAQYVDEVERQPLPALKILAPYLLEKDDLKQWLSDVKKAKKPKGKDDTPVLPAEFPDVSKWKNVTKHPEIAIQAGRILTSFGKYQAAIAIYEKVGRALANTPRVLAAEGGGDLLMTLQRYMQAIEWFSFGLKTGEYIKKSASYESDPDKVLDFILQRIRRKLAKCQKLIDIEKFGAGFVMYRTCREFQLKGDCLRAAAGYEEMIEEVSDTVYSHAAVLYQSQCYFELSRPEKAKRAKMVIEMEEDILKKLKGRIKRYKKALSKRLESQWRQRIDELSGKIAELKKVPLGNDAAKAAQASLLKFIEDKNSTYKLYKGEAYVVLGEFYMERLLDPEKAEKILAWGEKWFKEVEKVDEALDGFQVPAKAAAVSAPPQVLTQTDLFDNLDRTKITPSHIVNRLTCPFYIDELRARLYSMKGFLRFARGDSEGAKECYAVMKKFDAVNKVHEGRGDWGDYKRLMWGVDHGYFYANKDELKRYSGRQRFAVLLADYFYITMKFNKARVIHNRMLAGETGKLSNIQKAYLVYSKGASLYWAGKYVDSYETMKQSIALGKGSYTSERAMYAVGSLGTDYMGNVEGKELQSYREEATRYLQTLSKKARNRDFRIHATFTLVMNSYKKGEYEKAEELLGELRGKTKSEKDDINYYRNLIQKGKEAKLRKETSQ